MWKLEVIHRSLLEKSVNPSSSDYISQQPWFLQHLAEFFCIARSNDKIIIIPLKKKWFGLQPFIPPLLQKIECHSLSDFELHELLVKIHIEFTCGQLCFQLMPEVVPSGINFSKRINHILSLNHTYDELYKNFNKGHKLNFRSEKKYNLQVTTSLTVNDFVNFYREASHQEIPNAYKETTVLAPLIKQCLDLQKGFLIATLNSSGQIISAAFFSCYRSRIIYHLSCSNPQGRKFDGMYAILRNVIENYASTGYDLDFEGSMIPGVAYFMKGFGSREEPYYLYTWNRHLICKVVNILRQLKARLMK